jgi:hypothetical protein
MRAHCCFEGTFHALTRLAFVGSYGLVGLAALVGLARADDVAVNHRLTCTVVASDACYLQKPYTAAWHWFATAQICGPYMFVKRQAADLDIDLSGALV